MKISGKIGAAIVMAGALLTGPAFAHSFNVALVIALSGEQEEAGGQFLDGFMLATTERDAHANQESDGHLGGLDVYVSLLDANVSGQDMVLEFAGQNDIDIVIGPWGSGALSLSENALAGQGVSLLSPGVAPEPDGEGRAIAAFRENFARTYGTVPGTDATQGYNAAQRIEIAVRGQGGVADAEALAQSFAETVGGFDW